MRARKERVWMVMYYADLGLSDEEIAEKIGYSGATAVHQIRSRFRIPTLAPVTPRASVQSEAARARHGLVVKAFDPAAELNDQLRQLGRRFGYCPDSVRRILRDAGAVKAVGKRYTEEQLAPAKELLEDGMPYTEVSQMLGVGVHALRSHFPGMGLAVEDRGVYRKMRRQEREMGLTY